MTAPLWDRVVGHDDAVATIRASLDHDRIAHAWLLTGPEGVGKAHVARLAAAALNCPAGPAEADGTCPTCRRVLRGVHPDVHQIEPEGEQLLVGDVRAMREEAHRSRQEGHTKVFVVDDADRMNDAAANALLKVLEEPPPQVVFFLVARSASGLVDTVPSRARTVPFAALAPAQLAAALTTLHQAEPDEAALAAAASRGRFGRAAALVTDAATRIRRDRVLDLADPLASGRAADALDAAATVLAVADEEAETAKGRFAAEIDAYDEAFGTGRGTAGMRRRLETRHTRQLRRLRSQAVRQALADLTAYYRDAAAADSAPLVHPDRRDETRAIAARVGPASVTCAAAALLRTDRSLATGATPQLACEAGFLSVQAALAGVPLSNPTDQYA